MKIALIGCTKTKAASSCKAIDMYNPSTYYRLRREYAEKVLEIEEKNIFILSAKHYLLDPTTVIAPYNLSLSSFTEKEKKEWAEDVLKQFLAKKFPKEDIEIYILAGSNYSRYLEKMLIDERYTVINVLKGKDGIGSQMGWLKDELKKYNLIKQLEGTNE